MIFRQWGGECADRFRRRDATAKIVIARTQIVCPPELRVHSRFRRQMAASVPISDVTDDVMGVAIAAAVRLVEHLLKGDVDDTKFPPPRPPVRFTIPN